MTNKKSTATTTRRWKAGTTASRSKRATANAFATREQAEVHMFDYIKVYYNRSWLHSTLGYLSPEAFGLTQVD